MGFTFNKKLPIPKEIKAMYPLSPENAAKKAQRDKEIRDVITGADDRFLVIIGPCSADNEPAVMVTCTVWFRSRSRLKINASSFHVFIPTSHVLPVKDTREWFISRIRKQHQIFWKV